MRRKMKKRLPQQQKKNPPLTPMQQLYQKIKKNAPVESEIAAHGIEELNEKLRLARKALVRAETKIVGLESKIKQLEAENNALEAKLVRFRMNKHK